MNSYTSVPTEEPPSYNQEEQVRHEGDNIPDDFKYSVNVASCELSLRHLFIRKVYSLLSVQIFATVLIGLIFRLNKSVTVWCFQNLWLFYLSIFGSFGFLIATHFKARSYPTNLILLGGFTACEAYGVGLACALFESEVLLQALLLTFVIFIGLTIFAFQTKYDFVSWEGALMVGVWTLIGTGLVFAFLPNHSSTMEMIYSFLGAAIFGVYVIVDTQKIMKTANLDDEIPATLSLYMDILNLFLFILRILNNQRRD
ncbi:Piso0_004527 [Millerozyma farinosa CBS 7064]|uniref:Piso0_004527 protein n=1 Tax=Pichia sorbitophila (strain ATCC MYA-4447 / BCRC 22081 / CBS 7064 / NBRC 10061 / NRRL Y-12695) TaxID=559304 RepID=G8Y916_PICSO|nr:Piso0_004527 [Millerozyma farinosa CBS 7064]CCE84961.1 Piso0_004527 [Millerozyma farinosa CBS 7064]